MLFWCKNKGNVYRLTFSLGSFSTDDICNIGNLILDDSDKIGPQTKNSILTNDQIDVTSTVKLNLKSLKSKNSGGKVTENNQEFDADSIFSEVTDFLDDEVTDNMIQEGLVASLRRELESLTEIRDKETQETNRIVMELAEMKAKNESLRRKVENLTKVEIVDLRNNLHQVMSENEKLRTENHSLVNDKERESKRKVDEIKRQELENQRKIDQLKAETVYIKQENQAFILKSKLMIEKTREEVCTSLKYYFGNWPIGSDLQQKKDREKAARRVSRGFRKMLDMLKES